MITHSASSEEWVSQITYLSLFILAAADVNNVRRNFVRDIFKILQ